MTVHIDTEVAPEVQKTRGLQHEEDSNVQTTVS